MSDMRQCISSWTEIQSMQKSNHYGSQSKYVVTQFNINQLIKHNWMNTNNIQFSQLLISVQINNS